MVTNPILTELSQLSPGAQQALVQAHGAMGGPGAAASPQNAAPPSRMEAPTTPPPMMGRNELGDPMGRTNELGAGLPAPQDAPTAPALNSPRGELAGDEAERSRLLSTGSGISQIHSKIEGALPNHPTLGKVLGYGAEVPARLAEAAGSMFAPLRTAEMLLPGTEAHHAMELRNLNSTIGKESQEGLQSAQTGATNATAAHTEAETPTVAPLAQSREGLEEAQTNEANARTATIPEEEADKHAVVQPTIQHLNAESTSLSNPRKTPIEATYDDLLKQGMTPIQAYEKVREKLGGTTVNEGTWAMDEDPTTGKPVLFNSKTGETKAAPAGVAKAGTFAKGQATTAPAKQAIEYADSYKDGIHTGPGDEALMEKFFELAKPSTGFRMSQPQIDMLKNAQSWPSSLEAHLRHATTGTWFSNDQRSQIVGTMHDLAKAKGLEGDGGAQGAPIVQHSASTGQDRYSTDGGKTWQQGKPPSR